MIKAQARGHEENMLAQICLKLARVLKMEGKYDEAITETQTALDADKNEFVALYLRAEIYEAKGDSERATKARAMAGAAIEKEVAAEYSKSSKKVKPDADPRVLFLSDTLWNGPSGYPALPAEIVSILEPRLLELSAGERVILGTAYFALHRVSDGQLQWEKAIAMDSALDNAVSHANLGHELVKAGDYRLALPHLKRAYELDPQNVTYRMDYEKATQKLSE